ncbi:MAG TPA: alanine--glyoxylate aminotransferase family protein [Lacipirellulaceae bacterium]|nr:alanine--glyoxylate aminotransferase family protein [Lacipirellulaceae bacterium]
MAALPSPLNAPVRTLLGPGPSDTHPRVLAALAQPTVGHLDPYYLRIMDELQSMLREVFRTKNRMTMAISGTGSAGQEATVLNLVEPGERVLICINGVFGNRLFDMAERAGGEVSKIERPWGEVFDVAEVKEALARVKPKIVAIVMAETSTGAWQPIEEIAAAVRDAGAMLIVDTVTALGGIPVEIDKWQVDAVYSGTQKCLGCPPGLAPVSFSERAIEKIMKRKEKVRSWYLDVSLIANYWGSDRAYHHTAPINMTYALHESLRLVLEEGLDTCIARHRTNHLALKAGLAAIGIEYATQSGRELPQLNAVRIPNGIDDASFRKALLARFSIEIGAGLGAFKGKVWRIGLMGYSSRQTNVLLLLAAMEQLLAEQGHRFDHGAAVAAANASYSKGRG